MKAVLFLLAFAAMPSAFGAVGYTAHASLLPGGPDDVNCFWDNGLNAEICETRDYRFEIFKNERVELTWNATPGTTGYSTTLFFTEGAPREYGLSEEVYVHPSGRYKVEIGNTDGTSIFLRIDQKTELFLWDDPSY